MKKVIIVTGGTSMIGSAVIKMFSSQGEEPIIIARTQSTLDKLVETLPYSPAYFVLDMCNDEALNASIQEIIRKFGRVDCLVHNTAIYPFNPVESLTLQEWEETIRTNLTTAFLLSKAVIPTMKQSHDGKLVFISSIAGEIYGLPRMSPYSATKSGLNGLMRSLAIELAPFNINVNSVSPGKMYDPNTLADGESELLLRPVPLRRFIEPNDIANMVLFLASDRSKNITGQNFVIDGGQSILSEESHIN